MAINPVQAYFPSTVLPEGIGAKKSIRTSGFSTLIGSFSNPEGKSQVKNQSAAAELLRIEMMQSSLSVSGDDQACRPSEMKGLESLLSNLTGTGKPGFCANASFPPRTADAGSALFDEIVELDPTGKRAEIDQIGETAAEFLGIPYRFGGEGATGIDCSSFVQQVFQEHEIDLPRTAREQIKMGSEVAKGDLQKGDLVFFQTYAAYPSHVGIYLGDGKMIHASSGKGEVTVSDMESDYYRSRFLGAKRVVA